VLDLALVRPIVPIEWQDEDLVVGLPVGQDGVLGDVGSVVRH
jgi:hypothetical protein